jgi:hypothetical protein
VQAFDADLARHLELEDKIVPRGVAMEKEAAVQDESRLAPSSS